MKKSYLLFIAAGLCCLAACNKEVEIPQETAGPIAPVKMITETISANFGHETKVTIDGSGTFAWTAGDNIAVHVSKGDTHKYVLTSDDGASGASLAASSASFTVVYEEGYARDAFAVYPSAIVATDAVNYGQSGSALDITLPSSYTLAQVGGETTPSPMIADNTGSGWEFKHLCGLLRLTVSNIPAEATKLKIDFNGRKVSGAFSVPATVTAGSSTIASVAGTKGSDDYIMITEIGDDDEVTITLPLPTGTAYSDLIVSAWNEDVALKAQVTPFSYTASNARGKKLTSALTLGAFSRATGKYIVFAPGNLWAMTLDLGDTWTWEFTANQYDYVGDKPANNAIIDNGKVSNNGSIDLFAYSTDNNYYGIDTYEGGNFTGSFKDWGENQITYNEITYQPNTWRTISNEECNYVFNSRKNVGFSSYAYGKVLDTNYGTYLFPDNYSHPVGLPAITGINTYGTADINTFNSSQWLEMQAAGCIYLPAAGCTDLGSPFDINASGSYRTTNGWLWMFYNFDYPYCSSGSSILNERAAVRLVRDLN